MRNAKHIKMTSAEWRKLKRKEFRELNKIIDDHPFLRGAAYLPFEVGSFRKSIKLLKDAMRTNWEI